MSESERIALNRNVVTSKSEEEIEGLSDGGHTLLKCSNCEAILMDVWVTRPHESEEYRLRASCPFCGDKSFITKVKGGFHYGGFGKVKPDDPDQDIPSTIIEKFEQSPNSNLFEFTILKANKDAKPVYS